MKAVYACKVAAVLFAAAVSAAPAWAADSRAPRTCGFDPTATPIPGFTPAEVDIKPAPRYPRDALESWSEGWVLLEYAITAEGLVRDMAVVDALGPKDFVDMSVKRVSKWRYKPATRNGQPVDQLLHQTSVLFLFQGSGRGAEHRPFVKKYNQARALIREEKFDDAIATLEEAFKARLNLYEEAMGSFALALAYAKKSDWPHALFHIRHAYIEQGRYLEKEMKAPALALLVEFEARDGSFNEALCAFEELKELDPASAAKERAPAKIVGQLETALKDPAPLAIGARLATHPLFDAPAIWRHQLLRSKFSFADIKGEVKSFRLACVGTSHDEAVDPQMQWNVPSNAGSCILRVDGAPGATFSLVEEW